MFERLIFWLIRKNNEWSKMDQLSSQELKEYSNKNDCYKSGYMDRFVRWLLTPNHSFQKEHLNHVHRKDLGFAIISILIKYYGKYLKYTGQYESYWNSNHEMLMTCISWNINGGSTFHLSWARLELFLTEQCDLIEFMAYHKKDGYYIDLTFLNDFEYKQDCLPIGCKAFLQIEDGRFKIRMIEYNGHQYYQKDTNVQKAIRVFFAAIRFYLTVCVHASNLHVSSAQFSMLNKKYLSNENPIKQWLDPLMLQTQNGLGRALSTLFDSWGVFVHFGPFTHKGVLDLVNWVRNSHLDFFIENMLGNELKDFAKLIGDDAFTTLPFFKSWKLCYHVIEKRVDQYLQAFIKYGTSKDFIELKNWVNAILFHDKVTLNTNQMIIGAVKIITYIFMIQFRHSYTTLPSLDFINSHSYMLKSNHEHLIWQGTKYDFFMKSVTDYSTNGPWPSITQDISAFLTHGNPFLQITKDLINDLKQIMKDLPGHVTISTGL